MTISRFIFITVDTVVEITVPVFILVIDDLMRLGCARQFLVKFDLMITLRKCIVACITEFFECKRYFLQFLKRIAMN